MARLGIDFGTTHTVVALCDRGSYPILLHTADSQIGRISQEVFPSISLMEADGSLHHGLAAQRRLGEEAAVVRSIKRRLPDFADGMTVSFGPGRGERPVREVLVGFLSALRDSVRASGLVEPDEPLEAVITWPAHANGAQRIVTREAFGEAGFHVTGSLNEPTASGIEYADRVCGGDPRLARQLKARVAVFDFGGGTLDVSLVAIDAARFEVLATAGLDDLGGDDLDGILVGLFCEELGVGPDEFALLHARALRVHARTLKETLAVGNPASLMLNPPDWGLDGAPVCVPVTRYLKAVRPLVKRAVDCLSDVLKSDEAAGAGIRPKDLDGIYLVGGSSRFPLVQKMVSQRFRHVPVITSDKPFTSVAVGAAIRAGRQVEVRDIFSRHFGVVRLTDFGRREVFDPIFRAGARLPDSDGAPLEVEVRYRPQHNIGRMRYLECARLDEAHQPGDAGRPWSPVLLPYDPGLRVDAPLEDGQVTAVEAEVDTEVQERYRCDSDGVITVEFMRTADGAHRRYEIFCD